jgi:hypothetical protein
MDEVAIRKWIAEQPFIVRSKERVRITEPLGDDCATHDCPMRADVHFEWGGVGSDYCDDCMEKILKQRPSTSPNDK